MRPVPHGIADQTYTQFASRVPLYQTASSHWRALSAGAPVAPTAAFSYMTRSLRQTAPHVIGALRLLAASYTPAELNKIGFSLYADFRPSVDGWGKHGEVRCSTILSLRKLGAKIEVGAVEGTGAPVESIVKVESADGDVVVGQQAVFEPQKTEPNQKKRRGMTFEEYEATFDEDITFDNIDVNLDDLP
ncbi:hypothetical protein AcV5_001224 [Taiwanofungus camphoratus]|nr:hypothetical protein AcV5_001224 [Antrodia cinnamomea]